MNECRQQVLPFDSLDKVSTDSMYKKNETNKESEKEWCVNIRIFIVKKLNNVHYY